MAKAAFPTSQTLSQHTHLVIAVRNDSGKTIPNVAVTILNPQGGTAADAFGQYLPNDQVSAGNLASRSRPIWIIDQPSADCPTSRGKPVRLQLQVRRPRRRRDRL